MRHLLALLVLFTASLNAQSSTTARRVQFGASVPGSCPTNGWLFVKTTAPNNGLYDCNAGTPRLVVASGTAGFVAKGTWSSGTTYATGDLVGYNGVAYVSIQGSNTNHQPDTSSTWWATPGPQGPTGATGATGAAGANGANGATGPAGTNGATILAGAGVPSGGANGDYFFRTDTGCFYGPKAAGAWPGSCTSLVGPQGIQGVQGPQGPQGDVGPTGPAGATGSTGPQGPQGDPGPTVYPTAGIARSTGSAWTTSYQLDTDTGLTANSDTNIPSQKAAKAYMDAKKVFAGVGTYAQMTAATLGANDVWLLTNAVASGLCSSGAASNTAFAICVKDSNGVMQPILAVTGGGGNTGNPTIYGGFTGGGATITISDADCSAGDDTTAVQNKVNLLANGGTVDFQNTTNTCDIGAAGIVLFSKTNVRITHSPTTHPTNGDIRAIASTTGNDENAILGVYTCDDCLVDKLKINANSQVACGFFVNTSSNFSIQNNEVYGCVQGAGTGPYAAIKTDDQTSNFWIANNNIHDLGGINGGEGIRGVWAGVGSRYSTTAHIIDNTIANTGHTGIIVEGQGPIVTGNIISNTLVQGTCMKFIPRGSAVDAVWDNNTCNRSYGAGWQGETDTVDATNIYVRNNQFTLMSDWTVNGSQNFPALYLSGGSGGTKNVRFTGNTITQGRKVAAYNNTSGALIQNNTIVDGLGSFFTQIACEGNASNITIINSGVLDKQALTCTNHTQDGVTCNTNTGTCQ